MSSVPAKLRQIIHDEGPVSFDRFMSCALYDAEHGYYSAPGRIGKSGDFYTSVSVGPLFGQLLADQFCSVWEEMGKPSEFALIERGANDGRLASDILSHIRLQRPDFWTALHYWIDEPLAVAHSLQKDMLREFFGKVSWDVPTDVEGIFIANELLDSIPFHRVRMVQGRWRELTVGLDATEAFTWVQKQITSELLLKRLREIGNDFPNNYTTELAPGVANEIMRAAHCIQRGVLFFIDYGFCAADYYLPERSEGTMRCYRRHTSHDDPLQNPGEEDITAHVDFSFAAQAARHADCQIAAFIDQGRFLTGAAEQHILAINEKPDPKWIRQFQSLTHPGHLGRSFHFFVLTSNLENQLKISGLRHASARAIATLG